MNTRSTPFRALLAATCLSVSGFVTVAAAQDAVLALVSSPADILSEPAPVIENAPVQDMPAATSAPDSVELAALYYYAEQKQDDRVQRETERLSKKYPGFTLPADLHVPAALRSVDEAALWALYDKQDFDGIDAEIARMKGEKKNWTPSKDFMEKLARKKQRVLIEKAVAAKDWAGVVTAGANLDPATEKDVDLLWNLIDAYHETGVDDALVPVYRGILFRTGADRLEDAALVTTLQKAVRDFPASDVRAVMDKIGASPAMKIALKPVTLDLIRKDIADFNADGKRTDAMTPADLEQFRAMALKTNSPEDLNLLGWYFLKLKDTAESETWFAKAMAVKPDEANAKGLYLALIGQKKDDQAWTVASERLEDLKADPEFLMNALSIRFAKPDTGTINADIVSSYSETILSTLSAAHAEILAWYAYNSGQFEAAEAWFLKSFAWEQSPARLKGLALSYQRQFDQASRQLDM